MPTNEQIELARMAHWGNVFYNYMHLGIEKCKQQADIALAEFDKRFPVERKETIQTIAGPVSQQSSLPPSPKEFWVHTNGNGEKFLTSSSEHVMGQCLLGCSAFQLFTINYFCVWKDPRKELPKASRRQCVAIMANNDIQIVDALLVVQAPNGFSFWSYHPNSPKE